MRLAPQEIQIIGSELAIRWSDGSESFFGLEFLRRHCPCATCGGEPDVMGRVELPTVTYTPRSFELKTVGPVGPYALQPEWADGHNTGLYTFQYLKRLEQALAGETAR